VPHAFAWPGSQLGSFWHWPFWQTPLLHWVAWLATVHVALCAIWQVPMLPPWQAPGPALQSLSW
jgi:hypothetical protein